MKKKNLFLKLEKCIFEVEMVDFLELIISLRHIHIDPVKVKRMATWPTPTNVQEIQAFLRFGNYYRQFIPYFTKITQSLHDLTKEKVQWN